MGLLMDIPVWSVWHSVVIYISQMNLDNWFEGQHQQSLYNSFRFLLSICKEAWSAVKDASWPRFWKRCCFNLYGNAKWIQSSILHLGIVSCFNCWTELRVPVDQLATHGLNVYGLKSVPSLLVDGEYSFPDLNGFIILTRASRNIYGYFIAASLTKSTLTPINSAWIGICILSEAQQHTIRVPG